MSGAVSHPPVTDSNGTTWTWRGDGYAVEGQPDRDWKGRPWTVQPDTIRKRFGEFGKTR